MTKLKFGKGNAKLGKSVTTFSLPAGRACPGAKDCLSMAIVVDGKRQIRDGKHTQFRCFAASNEVQYTATYEARKHNFDALRNCSSMQEMCQLIESSLPKRAKYVRVHVSGDFFNQMYFDAWCQVARQNKEILFYAYTKSIPYWVARLGSIPSNLVLTASVGGHHDSLIEQHELRNARVVYSEQQAADLGLEIDHDDSHAMEQGPSFALLVHGTQPKGSEAAQALVQLRKQGKGGYSKGKKRA